MNDVREEIGAATDRGATGRERSRWWYAVIFACVAAACVVWWFFAPRLIAPGIRSTVGEMFAPLSTFFSGLAFGGVILTVVLQSDELRLQRQEMEDTRRVLGAQQLQLEKQALSMQRQTFETTFFNLLSLLREAVASLPDRNKFSDVATDIRQRPVIAQEGALVRFDQTWDVYSDQLAPYLRTLNIAIDFAERAEPKEDVRFYSGSPHFSADGQ